MFGQKKHIKKNILFRGQRYAIGIDDLTKIYVGSNIVSAGQMVDKDLYARMKFNVRSVPSTEMKTSKVLHQLKPGDRVGKIYSWVKGYDVNGKHNEQIWWEFLDEDYGQGRGKDGKLKAVYVLHNSKAFDISALKDQGTKTVKEQLEDEKKKAEEDKPTDWEGVIQKGILALGVFMLAKSAIETRNG